MREHSAAGVASRDGAAGRESKTGRRGSGYPRIVERDIVAALAAGDELIERYAHMPLTPKRAVGLVLREAFAAPWDCHHSGGHSRKNARARRIVH